MPHPLYHKDALKDILITLCSSVVFIIMHPLFPSGVHYGVLYCFRTAFTTNSFYQELSSELLQFFGSPHQLSLPVLYGTVLVVTNLGPASIAEVLLPNFEGISKYLGVITKTAGMKNDASQLHEAILVRGIL